MNRIVLPITDLTPITFSTEPVFEDTLGLAAMYALTMEDYPPIRIVDNHNLVLPFWRECVHKRPGKLPITCLHIDQHADLTTPPLLPDGPRDTLDQVWRYTTDNTTIASFIVPALEGGILSGCTQIRSEYALYETINKKPASSPQSYILDIDLDFWSMSNDQEIMKHCTDLQPLMRNALCISIATSPSFIDQTKALTILKKLLT